MTRLPFVPLLSRFAVEAKARLAAARELLELQHRIPSIPLFAFDQEQSLSDVSFTMLFSAEDESPLAAPQRPSISQMDAQTWLQHFVTDFGSNPMEPQSLDDYNMEMLSAIPAWRDRRVSDRLQLARFESFVAAMEQRHGSASSTASTLQRSTSSRSSSISNNEGDCTVTISVASTGNAKQASSKPSSISGVKQQQNPSSKQATPKKTTKGVISGSKSLLTKASSQVSRIFGSSGAKSSVSARAKQVVTSR